MRKATLVLSCAAFALAVTTHLPARTETLRTYHVGNSLTWDTQPRALDDFSAQRGIDHVVGHHIVCGKSLTFIEGNPGFAPCVTPTDAGIYSTALPGQAWDAITLQLHYSTDSTLGSEVAAAVSLIDQARANPANADTRFVIYGAWPRTTDDYAQGWNAPIDASDSTTRAVASRAFQQAVYQQVQEARPGAVVEFLSIGELFYLADQAIKDEVAQGGDWFGFTDVDQLYRDDTHGSNESGRWLASVAMWQTLTGLDPNGLVRPNNLFDQRLTTDTAYRDGLTGFVADAHEQIHLVPEPSSLLALLAGSVLLFHRRRAS